MASRVYLDWNATAPLRPEARAVMSAALDIGGNPSSVHMEGREARRVVEQARAQVAASINARADDIVFTSGGTEANAQALMPDWSVGSRTFSAADRLGDRASVGSRGRTICGGAGGKGVGHR